MRQPLELTRVQQMDHRLVRHPGVGGQPHGDLGVGPGLGVQAFVPPLLTAVRQLVNGMGGRMRPVRPLEGGAASVLSF